MTTQEIKDLIMSKIAGQGSAVDAGSALPEILNGIVDALENAPTMPDGFIVDVDDLHDGDIVSDDRYAIIINAPFLKYAGEWFARINAIPDEVRAYIASGADVDEVVAVWGWCTYGVTEGTVEVDGFSVVALAPVTSGYKFIHSEQ